MIFYKKIPSLNISRLLSMMCNNICSQVSVSEHIMCLNNTIYFHSTSFLVLADWEERKEEEQNTNIWVSQGGK